MPNWVDNLIVIRGDKDTLDELANSVATPDNVFDFETILPTPAVVSKSPHYKEVNHSKSLFKDDRASKYPWLATIINMDEDVRRQEYIAYVKQMRPDIDVTVIDAEFTRLLGANERHWYNFNNKVWNTKWGSCDACVKRVTDNELRYDFTTAWDKPKAVADRLAHYFPELHITHSYLEEFNNISGAAIYKKGKVVDLVEDGYYYVDPSDIEPDTIQEL